MLQTNIDNEIRNAILHDMHKIFKKKHDSKKQHLGTTADGNAANMSRHKKATDDLTGEYLNQSFIFKKEFTERDRKRFEAYCTREYIESKDPTTELHAKLLNDRIVSNFNEITSMPYSSLKYHTLLVCALHYNYKKGLDFQDLYLRYTDRPKKQYTSIFQSGDFYLVIDDGKDGAHIGAPALYFGQTIGRLNALPLPQYITDNLKRFRSWSVGLQYLDDVLLKLKGCDMCRSL